VLIHGTLKRAIVERIREMDLTDARDGTPVQVESAPPPVFALRSVYANTVRWSQTELTAERALMARQTITVEIRIRVQDAGGDIDEAERTAEEIQAAIAAGVVAQPDLLAGAGSLYASSGDADPTVVAPDPESKVIVNLGVTFTAVVNTPVGV
jgi:hypothetical protein